MSFFFHELAPSIHVLGKGLQKGDKRTWVYGTHFDLGDKLTKKIAVCDEIVSIKKYESYKLTLKNKTCWFDVR
jgi:hypothetical protein